MEYCKNNFEVIVITKKLLCGLKMTLLPLSNKGTVILCFSEKFFITSEIASETLKQPFEAPQGILGSMRYLRFLAGKG